jgi:hypothetical protein
LCSALLPLKRIGGLRNANPPYSLIEIILPRGQDPDITCNQPDGIVTPWATRRAYGEMSWFHNEAGESHAELREALEESRGTPVAVGPYPSRLEDSDDVASAIVPDENGIVRIGVY